MSTADKLQQLRLERQKSDLSHKLQALQAQLERAEGEKNALATESGNKIKQALSLLDSARKEIDKLKKDKEALTKEVTELRRQNEEFRGAAYGDQEVGDHEGSLSALKDSRCNNGISTMGEGVVVRRRSKVDDGGSERPMSMAERMSMFEKKNNGSGRSFGNSPSMSNGGARASWRNAPPQVKLAAEDDKAEETSPVHMRPGRVSQHAKDNRHTMPANAYTPKQVLSPPSTAAASGRTKMRTALGGMMAAIETEKQHKGLWTSSRRRSKNYDIDKMLHENLETFDKTAGSGTVTPNHTSRDITRDNHTARAGVTPRTKPYTQSPFSYTRTSSKPIYDQFEPHPEDSDPEMSQLAKDLKSDLLKGPGGKIWGKYEEKFEENLKDYEKHFITKSDDLCLALNRINDLNIKEENKQFLIDSMEDVSADGPYNYKKPVTPYHNPLEPPKYSADPNKIDIDSDKHSALKNLMKKRHEYNVGPTRIFDKVTPTWTPPGLVRPPPRDVIKGETVDRYSGYTRSGLMSPQERVMENIKNIREGDEDVAQILPSRARLAQYVPPQEDLEPVQRPRGIFTPKLLSRPIQEPPKRMLLPENSQPAPFTYMNAVAPITNLAEIKLKANKKRDTEDYDDSQTNQMTSDDMPLSNGVKRGSVKNLAAMFSRSVSPVKHQTPKRYTSSSRTRRRSEGFSLGPAPRHPGLVKSRSLVFEDHESVSTGLSVQDLTCTTRYTDNTDRDIDTSIMDDTADSALFADRMLLPHGYLNGLHKDLGGLGDRLQRQYDDDEDDFDDTPSSASLSRAVSPVLKQSRNKGFKKSSRLSSTKPSINYMSDRSFDSTPDDQVIEERPLFERKPVSAKPALSTITSIRTTEQQNTDTPTHRFTDTFTKPLTTSSLTQPPPPPPPPVLTAQSHVTATPNTRPRLTDRFPVTTASDTTTTSARPPLTRSRTTDNTTLPPLYRPRGDDLEVEPSPVLGTRGDVLDPARPPVFDQSENELDCSQSSCSSLKENECVKEDMTYRSSQDDSKLDKPLTIIPNNNLNKKIPFSIAEYQKMFAEKQQSKEKLPKPRTPFLRAHTTTTTSSSTSSSTTSRPRGLVKCNSVQPRSTNKLLGPTGPKPATGLVGLVNSIAPPKTTVKRAASVAAPGSAAGKKAALLHWCQRMVEDKPNVEIKNFGSSWNNGMAFCALFHHFIPNQIPYDTLDPANREENFTIAFREGEKAGVTALLDVEDMIMMKNPDWMSVMTYVSLIYNHFNGIRVGGPRLPAMPGQE